MVDFGVCKIRSAFGFLLLPACNSSLLVAVFIKSGVLASIADRCKFWVAVLAGGSIAIMFAVSILGDHC